MPANLQTILNKLNGVRQNANDGYMALCPAHNDHKPSLSVKEVDGRLLLHCFAGCSAEEIAAALGLEMRDLFGGNGSKPAAESRVAVAYDYVDANGNLLYQVVRYEPKNFRQRRPNGNGGWEWNLNGVEPVPYRLPRVLAAINRGESVFIVEGEKDVHSLEAIGLIATTNSGGAGKWKPEYACWFENANVVILPDNDEPGKRHAQDIAQKLRGAATSVKIVELPNLPEKGDVSDWLAAGRTKDELLHLVAAAAEWEPAEPAEDDDNPFADETFADFTAEVPDWLLPGLLPRSGIVLLAGNPGCGKTTLVAEIVHHVVRGATYWGLETEQTNVLWLDFDHPANLIKAQKFMLLGEYPENRIFRLKNPPKLDRTALAGYIEYIKNRDIGLIVVDTLPDWLNLRDFDKTGDAVAAMGWLRELTNATGCCILGLAHLAKDPNMHGVLRVANSVAFTGRADIVAILQNDADEPERCSLAVEKSRLGEVFRLSLKKDVMRFVPVGQPPSPKTARHEVYEFIKSNGPVTRKALLNRFAGIYAQRTVDKHVARLIEDCKVVAIGGKKIGEETVYSLPTSNNPEPRLHDCIGGMQHVQHVQHVQSEDLGTQLCNTGNTCNRRLHGLHGLHGGMQTEEPAFEEEGNGFLYTDEADWESLFEHEPPSDADGDGSFDNGGTRSSDISDIKTAFSEKCSDSPIMREVLQKPRNDVTDVTVKTVETGKTAFNPAEEPSFANPQPVETGSFVKTGVDKTGDKTGSWQNSLPDKTGIFTSFANSLPDKTASVDKTGLTKLADKTAADKTADVTKLADDKTGLREVFDYIRAVGKTTRQELVAAYEGVYSTRTLDRYIKRLVSECLVREVHDRSNKNRVCYEPAGSFDNVPDQSSFDKTTLTKLTVETDKTVLPEPADKTGLSKQPADDDRLLSPAAALRQVHWYIRAFRPTKLELTYAFKNLLAETELNSILGQLIANGHIREIPDGNKLRYESAGFPLPETEPVEENIPDVIPQPNAENLPYVCQNPQCKQDVVLNVWKRKVNKEPLCYRYLCTHCGHDGLCTVADYEYWLKREAMFERIRAKKNKPTDEPDKDDGRLVAVDVESKLTTIKDSAAMKGENQNVLRQNQPANYYTQSIAKNRSAL